MNFIERLLCALLGHKYVMIRRFTSYSRQIGCTRCNRVWGMDDRVKCVVPWDKDLEDLHRLLGHLK